MISKIINKIISERYCLKLERQSIKEGNLDSFCQERLKKYGLKAYCFDNENYLSKNIDAQKTGLSPLAHFLKIGLDKGLEGRFFDEYWYNNFHTDIGNSGLNAFYHYDKYGRDEARVIHYLKISREVFIKNQADYGQWLKDHDEILHINAIKAFDLLGELNSKPLISILMPVYNTPLEYLEKAIQSVQDQYYDNWELCIADDVSPNGDVRKLIEKYASADKRIKYVFRKTNGHICDASNSALELVTGEFCGLLDHDDELSKDALLWVAKAINENPKADLIYSDEDKIDEHGNRFDPYFKPEFNYELLLAQNMICHFGVYRSYLLKEISGFRSGFEGAQDHDLALRIIEKSEIDKIIHIPRILYHWRAITGSTALNLGQKIYATKAGLSAVESHIERIGIKAEVSIPDIAIGHYRVRYDLPKKLPLISIIIPTRDRVELLSMAISSIDLKSSYENYEIIIIDNDSVEARTHEYFDKIKSDKIRIIRDESPFNFSYLNNLAARYARGEYLLFLNNDIEIISRDWLEEMLSFAQFPDIGCVGARLYYPDDTVQHAGVILGIGGVAGHAHKHLMKGQNGYFNRAVLHQSLSAITAACLMIRKNVFEEIGGFDEGLAIAFNDIDLCLKVRMAGYRNVYTPYAEAYHHESKSRGKEDTDEKVKRFNSEVETMIKRWGDKLLSDPAYNPNLTIENENFHFAFPPRLNKV